MNLYIHFPFCRSKCAYCALHSSASHTAEVRRAYVERIVHDLEHLVERFEKFERFERFEGVEGGGNQTIKQSNNQTILTPQHLNISTIYFGGGTPALCDLRPILDFLSLNGSRGRSPSQSSTLNPQRLARTLALPTLNPQPEFTVELNPLDVTPTLLDQLKAGGVNRLSMGVQSLDDDVLRSMGRPHTAAQALDVWRMIRDAGFDNAGIDLICGWPGERRNCPVSDPWRRTLEAAAALAPEHCSVYTLILEPNTRLAHDVESGAVAMPPDDVALAELAAAERALGAIGLERYEISSFAKPGMECRHNLATWRGEDYIGLGDGACSREGNAVSRVIFRLRLLKEGFSPVKAAEDFPQLVQSVQEWCATLDRFVAEGLLTSHPSTHYFLTPRGAEVCDTILAELV